MLFRSELMDLLDESPEDMASCASARASGPPLAKLFIAKIKNVVMLQQIEYLTRRELRTDQAV